MALWNLGQCGFVWKNQVTVYIDPVFNDLTGADGVTRRNYPAPFSPEMAEGDYVLCTHGHADHMAVETLTGIAASSPWIKFIVPGAWEEALSNAGIEKERIFPAKAGQQLELPGLTVFPVSAAHPVHQTDEEGRDTALCYFVTMGEIRLLHLGDTYLTDSLLEDLQKLPPPHLFFPPINGGDYFRTRRNCIGNLSYVEAAALAKLLHADMTIPTHYDMIQGNTIDPLIFAGELMEQDPSAKWHIPALGERFIYQRKENGGIEAPTAAIKELSARKSVRVFTEQPISEEAKRMILQAAMEAPTAGNQQLYTILDITDQELKETLSETCDHQPFIAKAKMVLIFCADCQKWYDAYQLGGCEPRKPSPGDLMLAVSDASIAAQNAVTAAHSLGIGSCYIGDIMEQCETHRRLLKLPEYVFPAAMVVFGYPTAQQRQRKKPERCSLRHIVQENGYRRMEEGELREMFRKEYQGKTFESWIQAFCSRKYNSDFSREMGRSVQEYWKSFSE